MVRNEVTNEATEVSVSSLVSKNVKQQLYFPYNLIIFGVSCLYPNKPELSETF